ncbi:Structural constituent of ribosome protein [Rhynchospora pubera]|uniref:Structural constituent of ribosome protein n=1 Tax=Rhynchospora pubera TaxID=906938 RepID=A0AAV8HCS3_9POAL|nr:Structural constituent of ribosome protein [Rhynchospora pubera]
MGILFLPLPSSPLFASPSSLKRLETKKPCLFPTSRRSLFPRLATSSHAESNASASAFLDSDAHSSSQTQFDPPGFRYKAVVPADPSTESMIERVIFDFRFLALLAVGGSLAGSLLCFLNGCIYIVDAYRVYWTSCVKGVHTGQMVLRLVEAIDVYLAGTVMLIFGMGLYGLFISNVPPGVPPVLDRALKGSSLFGMFSLKERPKWMKISSLDELKTKVGHVIVMILLVKMFERSKMVVIATGLDLLSYSVCIFLSSASLYILHNLHKSDE